MNTIFITGSCGKDVPIILRGTLFHMYDFLTETGVVQVISTQQLRKDVITIQCRPYSYFAKKLENRRLVFCLLFLDYYTSNIKMNSVNIMGHIQKIGRLIIKHSNEICPLTVTVEDMSQSSYIPCCCKGNLAINCNKLMVGAPIKFIGKLNCKPYPHVDIQLFSREVYNLT